MSDTLRSENTKVKTSTSVLSYLNHIQDYQVSKVTYRLFINRRGRSLASQYLPTYIIRHFFLVFWWPAFTVNAWPGAETFASPSRARYGSGAAGYPPLTYTDKHTCQPSHSSPGPWKTVVRGGRCV